MTSTSSASAHRLFIPGPAGQIEVIQDLLVGQMAGIAVVTHPHPLLGGTAEHKVPQLIARACQAHGYLAVRPNFRGAGGTTGTHDAGSGETEDTLVVARHFCSIHPGVPLVLAGFSFGAFVQTLVGTRMADDDNVHARMILVGTPSGPVSGGREYATPPVPEDSLVIHGEYDEVVSLQSALDWARPQSLPVVVVPGANHFFTGALVPLRRVLDNHLKVR
jgi:alpha/beta superfamily hydrolase